MNRARLCPALVSAFLAFRAACAADWEMAVTEGAALRVSREGAPVVTASYGFWGAKWKYAAASLRVAEAKPDGYAFSGDVPNLGLKVRGSIARIASNALKFTYELDAEKSLDGVIGGGLEFSLKLDSPAFRRAPASPVLLGAKKGWSWDVGDGEAVTVSFDAAVSDVYFERGQKDTIRTFFVGTTLAQGRTTVGMTVTLPKGGAIVKSLGERYGPEETATWVADALLWNKAPVDLRFLNDKPAGKRGFVRAKGDQLVFEDGTPARFWGGNIAAYAIFLSSKEAIQEQACRIAQLGYNLMRFHHHDSMSWVKPNVIDMTRDDSQHLDPAAMDKLDWWIKCLRDEGVYVWLDLHVGRVFKPGDGITTGFEEIKRGGAAGFCCFNPRLQELMKEFNAKYLSHVNPYTGLAYKDDPAIMGLLIINEATLTTHFGNRMLPDKGNPIHNRIFTEAVRAFCAKTGLPYAQTWRTWEPGPSKIFLNEFEHRFNQAMLAGLKELGVRIPVATTNYFGNATLCGLPALADSAILDIHSYGGSEALSANPRSQDSFVATIASARVHGKPVSITEWNVPFPTRDRFTAPLYVASIAALQGWNAPMIYNYSQQPFEKPGRPHTWCTYPDPALTAIMPAAAIAFRQGHIAAAKKAYCVRLGRQQLYYERRSAANTASVRTLVEQSKLTIGLPDVQELDWDGETVPAEGVVVVADPDQDLLPAGQSFVQSDTGELRRDWVKGIQTIDTPKTQAAQGWLGGEAIELKDCSLRLATPKATIAVTSLDDAPIALSKHLLITTIARVLASGGKMPFLSEPVRGTLTIRSKTDGLKLFALAADGARLPTASVSHEKGEYTIRLPDGKGTHWYLLTATDVRPRSLAP